MYDKVNANYGDDIIPVRPIVKNLLASKLKGKTYILITGTKGKTSTSTFIYKLLLQKSQKVALFTSPHVESFCERIQFAGNLISQSDYDKYTALGNQFLIDNKLEYHFFLELYLGAMFYFLDNDADYFVIEIGMGGKYDFTNIVDANYAIFTDMGLDHQKYLGRYLVQILYQKAHIVKPTTLFINSAYHSLYSKFWLFIFQRLLCKGKPLLTIKKLKSFNSIAPEFQQKNYSLAKTFVEKICPDFTFTDIDLQVIGRLQKFTNAKKTLIIDGAHNQMAIKELLKNIDLHKKYVVFFNMTFDREPLELLILLKPIASKFVVYSVENVNLINEALLDYTTKIGVPIELYQKSVWNESDNFLATGSFRHLSLVKDEFMSLKL